MSFDQSFSESFMGQTSFDHSINAFEPAKGEFFRMVTSGIFINIVVNLRYSSNCERDFSRIKHVKTKRICSANE